jgi:DsbC/DsbD-like thiol-disulfide interchange protein
MAFEASRCQEAVMRAVKSHGVTRRALLVASCSAMVPFALPVITPALADAALQSAWSKATHSEIRLIAGGPVAGFHGKHLAGIAFRMNPGFKTYWRHPGDSGVPPVFHFEGSDNLKSAEVRFPAPVRFADGAGGFSFGYTGPELILPIGIMAIDPAKPVHLKLRIEYAVCEKLCVPASGRAELVLGDRTRAGAHSGLLLAEQRVPALQKLGEGKAMKVVALRKAEQPEHFLVDVIAPPGTTPELIIEGESPWFLETKRFTSQSDGSGTYLIAVIERSKASDCTGADLALTLVGDKNAIEVRTRLDLALVTP